MNARLALWTVSLCCAMTSCVAEDPDDPTAATTAEDTTLGDTSVADDESTVGDTTTEGPRDEACACILDEPYTGLQPAGTLPMGPTCGDSPCAPVTGSCPDDGEGGCNIVLDDADALACALTALRDRTPGVLSWSVADPAQMLDPGGYVLVLDDGRAIARSFRAEDLSGSVSDATLGALDDAAVFDACLLEGDGQVRFDCLTQLSLSDPSTCDTGWTLDYSGD